MIKNYQIQVVGKVQGVWFRKYTYDEALKLNLKGFVRNEQNGAVYVEAEGTVSDLTHLLRFLEKGSPMSKVISVNYEVASVQNYTDFVISR